jgi:hypothetical protein
MWKATMYYSTSSGPPSTALACAAAARQEAAWQRGAVAYPKRRSTVRDRRYSDVEDRRLADQLATEDADVEAGLSPFERLTCPAHRRWMHECISSPQHVSPVTGHRWCRDCQTAATVAIDELCGDVSVTCPQCGRAPDTIATRQIVRACRASLATAQGSRGPVVGIGVLRLDERRGA